MIKLQSLLLEQNNKLKVIFMAGSSGSGKSYVLNQIFGTMTDNNKPIAQSLTGLGFKILNVDSFFEYFLKKYNIGIDTLQDKDNKEWQVQFGRAVKRFGKLFNIYKDQRLGFIIDSTGADISRIKNLKTKLEEVGYDTYLIFVDVPLDVAIERDKARGEKGGRNLGSDVVTRNWNRVQENKTKLFSMFKPQDRLVVVNDGKQSIINQSKTAINKFVAKPIDNPVGKEFLELIKGKL